MGLSVAASSTIPATLSGMVTSVPMMQNHLMKVENA